MHPAPGPRGSGVGARVLRWPFLVLGVVLVLVLAGGLALVGSRHHSTTKTTAAAQLLPSEAPATASAEPTTPATSAAPIPSSTPVKKAKRKAPLTEGVSLDDPNPTLGPIPTPSWAQEPPKTTILHSNLSLIKIYNYTKGVPASTAGGVLITLNNPTLEDLTFTLAGFGEQNGFYLALLDVRPNETFGWVKASDVTVSSTPYRIEISQTQHRLLLWDNDTVVGNFAVAVGKPSTPTPIGYFFVNTILKQSYPAGDYGPWIVSSSGFSDVYDTFGSGGGDAAIGLHGSDEPLLIGQSVSHGCIRMYNSDITLIAHTVIVGTLFEIHE